MATDTTHECPVRGCTARVQHNRLMCLQHWRRVPKGIGAELYDAYADAPLGPRHRAAMDAAIKAVNAKIGGTDGTGN